MPNLKSENSATKYTKDIVLKAENLLSSKAQEDLLIMDQLLEYLEFNKK